MPDSDAPLDAAPTASVGTSVQLPVEEQDVIVLAGSDPVSWEAAFPPEQRPGLREYAERPNTALVLVDVREITRGLLQDEIVYLAATTLHEVPASGYEPGQAFDAWVSTESPFEPAVPDDLRVGEQRVLLVERVLWKRLILCVSAPVSVSEPRE